MFGFKRSRADTARKEFTGYLQDVMASLSYTTVPDLHAALDNSGYVISDRSEPGKVTVAIPGYFSRYSDPDHLANSNTGDCLKLSLILVRRAEPKAGMAGVAVAYGTEPQYFGSDGSSHCCLLFTEKPIVGDEEIIGDHDNGMPDWYLRILRSAKPILADPSFGKVSRLSRSGFNVLCMAGKHADHGLSDLSFVYHQDGVSESFPLGFNGDGLLVSLTLDPASPHDRFAFTTQREGGADGPRYPLDGNLSRVNSPEMEELLDRLKRFPVVDSRDIPNAFNQQEQK